MVRSWATVTTIEPAISYDRDEEIFFLDNFANTTFVDEHQVDRAFGDALRFWRTHASGRRVYIVVDYTGVVIDPKVVDYFARKRAESVSQFTLGAVRYGGDLATRTALRAMAVKTHIPSNLYATREDAIAIVRGLRSGRIEVGASP
jgi:hypothetical protein